MGKRARAGKQNENECENESEIGSGELNIVIIGNPSSPPLRKKYEKKFVKNLYPSGRYGCRYASHFFGAQK